MRRYALIWPSAEYLSKKVGAQVASGEVSLPVYI
jgi:hypothetical protein